MYTEEEALEDAVRAATQSPCAKSQRGVVIWNRELFDYIAMGWNHPPKGFDCDGSEACREYCNRVCVHAEQHAILQAKSGIHGYEMLHVKVVDGEPVPSGPPSCWQCSRLILEAGISKMWLLHESDRHGKLVTHLQAYSAEVFHSLTLQNCHLPIVRGQ